MQSGELFTGQLTAFLPRPTVIARIEDAAPSDRPCEWKPAGKDCVSTRAYRFRANHVLLSLCRFHAKVLARKKGVVVAAVCEKIAA
jgi:hypothetical protein